MGEGSDEAEFINEIDCQFPYSDRERALALASEALSISANAAFAVVYELCFVPRGVEADPETRRDVLARIEKGLSHPLKGAILPVARGILDGRRLPCAEQIALMREVQPFRNQYAALQVAYQGGDPDEPFDDELDRVYDEIVASWDDRGLKAREAPPRS